MRQRTAIPSPLLNVLIDDVRSLSDESLLAGLGSGDPERSAAFVRRFQARVFGLAMTIVGDADVAEEVAQESLLRAWRHADTYDPSRGRVLTWLLTITRNVALDALRMRQQIPMDPATITGLVSDGGQDPEERGLVAHESRRLRVMLAGLPEEQRRAVLLAAFYGRTAREIGDIEGIPLGTAKTRIRTAMLKLREALEVRNGR
jgi:RNA polymerase sigma-70 factor (ECF subfamily)